MKYFLSFDKWSKNKKRAGQGAYICVLVKVTSAAIINESHVFEWLKNLEIDPVS